MVRGPEGRVAEHAAERPLEVSFGVWRADDPMCGVIGDYLRDHFRAADPTPGAGDVFVAVIGPSLGELGDPLRDALARGMRIVPVLVYESPLPVEESGLAGLADWPAVEVADGPHFTADLARLVRHLRGDPDPPPGGWTRTIDVADVPLELVWVPAGRFWMGATREAQARGYDPDASLDEEPVREVGITRGFWLGRHPVTVGQYRAFAAATGRELPPQLVSGDYAAPDLPVTHVSWHDARAFGAGLTTPDGLMGSLPTEVEWEYAARGTDGRRYPWGDAPPDEARAVFADNRPRPVGGRPAGAGPFGGEDQAGNVSEWCRDAYVHTPVSAYVDPCRSGDTAALRVIRGGSWDDPSRYLRAAFRFWSDPEDRHQGRGFRVLLRPASSR